MLNVIEAKVKKQPKSLLHLIKSYKNIKWVQHFSNAHKNLKFQALVDSFGWEGYGLYWICIELVAEQGTNYRIIKGKGWRDYIKRISHYDDERLDKFLALLSDTNLIDKKSLPKGDLYIPKMKDYSDDWTKRKKKQGDTRTFPKGDYLKVEKAYIKIKGVEPRGDEWLPIQRYIKSMFKSNRTPDEIIRCMGWMAEDDFYKKIWTMSTVSKKIAEFLSGGFEEKVKIPPYVKPDGQKPTS